MARVAVEKNIAFDDVRKIYYVNFDYGKGEDGKRIKKQKTFKTVKEAKKALTAFTNDKNNQNIVRPTGILLKAYLEYWLNDIKGIRCEETTLSAYRNIVNNHIIPEIGELALQKITPSVINKYMRAMTEKGLSDNTIRKHYVLLKDCLKYAVHEEKLLKNPLDKVEQLKATRTERDYYTPEQLEKLFELVKGDKIEIVVRLASLVGLRREEISALKWKNVDFEKKEIRVVEARTQAGGMVVEKATKNASSRRSLHISDSLLELLKKIKQEQAENKKFLGNTYIDNDFVICKVDGTPHKPNYWSDLLLKIVKDNQLDHITLHGLRHTFTSIANDEGVTMFSISKALGHSNLSTTSKIYTHLFDVTHKDAITKVAEVFE